MMLVTEGGARTIPASPDSSSNRYHQSHLVGSRERELRKVLQVRSQSSSSGAVSSATPRQPGSLEKHVTQNPLFQRWTVGSTSPGARQRDCLVQLKDHHLESPDLQSAGWLCLSPPLVWRQEPLQMSPESACYPTSPSPGLASLFYESRVDGKLSTPRVGLEPSLTRMLSRSSLGGSKT